MNTIELKKKLKKLIFQIFIIILIIKAETMKDFALYTITKCGTYIIPKEV